MKSIISLILILTLTIIANLPAKAQQGGGALQNRTNENNMRFGLPDDIKNQLDKLFDALIKKEYKAGLEQFLLNSPISKKDDDFASILKEIGKSINLYGDIKGYEIVDFNIAGSSYFKVKIIGLHQKFPTR